MSPEDALRYGVRDKSFVRGRITGNRELIFGDVLVRVDPSFKLAMHIDTDEGNAANVKTGARGYIDENPKRRIPEQLNRHAEEAAAPKMGARRPPPIQRVKQSKGPVMTLADEFYKVGPGPSSSHTIGPMRITYDFYQRCTKLPADQLAKATGLKVHLFGSLSATGKGHGTEHAALAGLLGKEPATVDPLFLDEMKAKPEQTYPVKLGDKTFNLSLADIIYDVTKGDFPHPNTMTCKLMGGDKPIYVQEYYSGRRRLYRMEGLPAAEERPAKISLLDNEGTASARREKQSFDCAGNHGERSGCFWKNRGNKSTRSWTRSRTPCLRR